MRACFQRSGQREKTCCREQISANFIERQNNAGGAREKQKCERAVDQTRSKIHAYQGRGRDQTEGGCRQREAVKYIERATHLLPVSCQHRRAVASSGFLAFRG